MKQKILKIFALTLLIVSVVSCNKLIEPTTIDSECPAGKAKLVLNVSNSEPRTIFAPNYELEQMGYTLKGTKDGGSEKTIKSELSYAQLTGETEILVDTGTWNFTLEAKYDSVYASSSKPYYFHSTIRYVATLEGVTVKSGVNNISFVLKDAEQTGTGSFSITFTYPRNEDVYRVKAALLNMDLTSYFDYSVQMITRNGETEFVTYSKSYIPNGDYFISFKFYRSNGDEIKPGYSELIQVRANMQTNASRSIDSLEKMHSISYRLNSGSVSGSAPASFSEYRSLKLPPPENMSRIGYTFGGWYTTSNFTDEPITEIPAGTTNDVTVYAKWDIITYTITYENIKTATNPNPATYTVNNNITLRNLPSITIDENDGTEKWVFKNWTKDDKDITEIRGSEDLVLKANWKLEKTMRASSVATSLADWLLEQTCEEPIRLVISYITTSEELDEIATAIKNTSATNKIELVLESSSSYNIAMSDSAFSGVTNLISISIPSGIKTIGEKTFQNCENLESVTINIAYDKPLIGDYAFDNCINLVSVTLSNGSATIGDYAFRDCAKLSSVTLPSYANGNGGVTIGKYAFQNCTGLEAIKIPSSVVEIKESAFDGCTGLRTVEYDSINSWCQIDFADPKANPLYYAGYFNDRKYIYTFTINSTSIGKYAFYNCANIYQIIIPSSSSLASIGEDAFYNCTGLRLDASNGTKGGVYISDLSKWCNIDFANEYSSPFYYGNLYEGNTTTNTLIKNLVIPEGTTTIKDYAFAGSNIKSVFIPGSVTTLETNAFKDCTNMDTVYAKSVLEWIGTSGIMDEGRRNLLKQVEHLIINGRDMIDIIDKYAVLEASTAATTLSTWLADRTKTGPFYVVVYGECTNDNLTAIANVLKQNAAKYVNLDLSETTGVTSISRNTFDGCKYLESIVIPNGVTTIDNRAFYNCSALTNVTIPPSVTRIGTTDSYNSGNGYGAFSGCSALANVYITSLENWCAITFKGYDGDYCSNPLYYARHLFINGMEATNLVIPNGVESISEEAFYNFAGIETLTIPGSVTTIGEYAFYSCANLSTVTINSGSLGTIPKGAFGSCEKLTTVIIGNGVTVIDNIAFRNCTALTDVTIPPSVTRIGTTDSYNSGTGYSVFSGCSALTNVYITSLEKWCAITFKGYDGDCYSNPLYYAKNLYVNNSKVTSLVIPNGVTSINYDAFYNFAGVESVTISGSVTTIGSYAFYNCANLARVTIQSGSLETISKGAFGNCASLTTVTIGNGVTVIDNCAFRNCTSLANVMIPPSVTRIGTSDSYDSGTGYGVFSGCSALTNVYITSLENWCAITFKGYDGHYCSNPLYYAKNLYVNNSKVTNLVIPSTVPQIFNYAFYNFPGFTSVTIPERTNYIGYNAFKNCSNITKVTFANTSGWCYYTSENASSGTAMNVSDIATNATNLTGNTWGNYYLRCK